MQELYTQIEDVLRRHAKASSPVIAPDSSIQDQLEIDSMDFVDVLVDLEEKLDIQIPDDDVIDVETIADLVGVIERLRDSAAPG